MVDSDGFGGGGAGSRAARRAPERFGAPVEHLTLGRLDDVRGLQTLRALHDVELDLLAFVQCLEAVTGDRLEVYEYVLTTLLRDEAESLLRVEPFHGTNWHVHYLLSFGLVFEGGCSTIASRLFLILVGNDAGTNRQAFPGTDTDRQRR